MGNKAKAIFIIFLVALAFFIMLTVSFNWEGGGDMRGMHPEGIIAGAIVVEGCV